MNDQNLAFIGAGNMATSLISGLVRDGYPPGCIRVSDVDASQSARVSERLGVVAVDTNLLAAASADVVILAVKPQYAMPVLKELSPCLQGRDVLLISVAAGIGCESLSLWAGGCRTIVRAMPNTPAMVQCGATGLYAMAEVSESQRARAESILRAVGLTVWVKQETQMDVITALSGSGPAYFFLMMEAMAEAGLALGLDEEVATLLAQQTALGAGRVAIESDELPGMLRQRVTSPGGTTERALRVFAEADFKGLVLRAMDSAAQRAAELSKEYGG